MSESDAFKDGVKDIDNHNMLQNYIHSIKIKFPMFTWKQLRKETMKL